MRSDEDDAAGSRTSALQFALEAGWTMALFTAIITAALGIIILVWPSETLKVLSILLGLQLLLFGLFRLISAFSTDTDSPGIIGFVGVIGMIAGVLVLRHPFETVTLLATILGVVWIVSGSIDLMSALADSSLSDRGFTALAGLLSVAGGVIVVAWPSPTLLVISVIGGIYLVATAAVIGSAAMRMRAREQSLTAG
jgi:uncharacterized membrane protein HdeD (DUF308 family)